MLCVPLLLPVPTLLLLPRPQTRMLAHPAAAEDLAEIQLSRTDLLNKGEVQQQSESSEPLQDASLESFLEAASLASGFA